MIQVGNDVLFMVNGCIFEIKEINPDNTMTIENDYEIYHNVSVRDIIFI